MGKPTQLYFAAGAAIVIMIFFLTTSWHTSARARTADDRLHNFIDMGGSRNLQPMFFANPNKDIHPYHEPLNPFPLQKRDQAHYQDPASPVINNPDLEKHLDSAKAEWNKHMIHIQHAS